MSDLAQRLADAGIEVKPLEWGKPLAGFYKAKTLFGGEIGIMWDMVNGAETFILHPGTPERKHCPTLEAAKAAAQADYEARILASLHVKEGRE